ncbi:HYR domain-containing protein [Roseimarinus sediminis]|uniref:HYR domain-containing protein n=1 Tax=Roseimarinus sediminis TaxID=1610899 RepID=UPI003D1E5F7C
MKKTLLAMLIILFFVSWQKQLIGAPSVNNRSHDLELIDDRDELQAEITAMSTSTLDTDGDGVSDEFDLDDDNDGILDTNECTSSNFFWSNPPAINGNTATGTINGIAYTYTSSVNVTSTSYLFGHHEFPASYQIPNANPSIQNIYPSTNTLSFASPMTNPVLVFASIGGGPVSVPINFSAPVEILWSKATVQNSPTQITGTEGYAVVRLNGTFSSITFDYLTYENWVNFVFGADFYSYCDTDGDGITDNLDLDSDNDGCYDAIEGSLGLDPGIAPNGMISGSVDSNGIPLLASSLGQGAGTSTNASATCFCDLGIDTTVPVVLTRYNTVFLDATGNASITPQAVNNGSYDNCGSLSLSLDDQNFDCSDLDAKNVATIVSDNTWTQSTVEYTTPGQYVSVVNLLPDISTYTLPASNAWPYGTVNFFSPAVPGAQPIYANGGTKFYRNEFQLSGRPESLRIRARVDNIMEIFVNGISIGMEDDIDGANFSNTVYHDVFIDDSGIQNGYMGGMQFDAVTSQSILDLLHEGANEIVFAIANSNGTDQGGFMVRMDAVAAGVPVVLTATDPNGNSSDATAFVVVKDKLAPAISTQPISLTLQANGTVSITANDVATVTDNCSVATVELSQYVFGINDALNSPVTVMVTATDASGNVSSQPVEVSVIDPVPLALCQDITVELDENGFASITPEMIDNGSSSEVGIADLTLDITSFDCSDIGANSVTLTVTSTLGTTATCSAMVTVVDQTAPVLTCPGNILVNNTPSQCGANVNFTASVSDNCSTTLTYSHEPNSFFPIGITPVSITATDASGNTVSCTFNVEVVDVELPSISCPFDIVVNAQPGVCGAVVNYELPTGNDNCGTEAPPTSIPNHTFKGYYNGHTYFLSNSMVPPETAHANALAAGGYLATIADAQENQFISNMHPDRIWIGYTDRDVEGSWRWITNEPVNYTNWSAGEPNNAGNEDWAVINWSGPTWNDWYYTQPAYYVIEFGGGGIPANLVAGLESGSVFPVGTTEVTYEVLDPSGNRVECTFNVTVNDNQAPVAVAQNLELQLDQNGQATLTAAQVDNGSSDNCEIASMVLSKTNFDCSNLGNNQVTLSVSDVSGNTASAQAVITVVDKLAPTISCAADIVSYDTAIPEESMVYNVPAGGQTSGWSPWVYTFADPLPFGATITGVDLTFTAVDQGWGGTGANANMYFADTYIGSGVLYHGSMTHTLNYEGVVPAYNYGGNNTLKLYHVGWPGWVAYWQGGTFTIHYRTSDACEAYVEVTPPQFADNCGGLILTNNLNGTASATGSYPIGVTEVEWTVSDASGNTAVCTQQITVIDNTPPDVLTNNIVVTLDEFGQAGIYAEDVDAGSTDNCGIASLLIDLDQFDCSNVGDNIVSLTVTDIHGNSATETAIVTVEDHVAPVALAQDITIQLDELGAASITPAMIDNGSNDACGIASLALSQLNFDCAHVGPNTITLIVSDVNGNVSTADAIVTVQDVTPPVVLVKDITVQLDVNGQLAFSVNDIDDGSYDVCGLAVNNMAQTPFTCENIGENIITLVLTDVNGNTASANAVVTVEDNVAPQALAQDLTIQLDANGQASITPEEVDNGSNDACGIASLALSQLNFDCAHVGPNTVTLTVTDVNGNVSTVDAVVTVEDNVAPVALAQNITIQLDELGAASITPEMIDDGSNDACGIASLALSQLDFDCSHVGPNTVTLTVSDVNGNVSTIDAVVTVEDNIAPTLTVPADIIQLNDPLVCGAFIEVGEAISADNCAVASVVNDSPGFFNVGETTVTWTVTDVNGNTTTLTQLVIITNDLPLIDELQVDTNIERDEEVTASATFTDNNVLYATFEWGDGSSSDGVISGQSISGSHVYTETGLYTVNLIIEDACGEIATQTFNYVVIWSPCEGKLTAGGWMNYLPGNWLEQPALSGKAMFEINAQYKKHGGLEGKFNFNIKNKGSELKLKSSELDWLMINGNWAVLSGSAKVGNQYGYTFQLAVIDGGNGHHATGTNNIRVIIWDPSGHVIFDNEQGLAPDQQPSTEIARGSIQIHKKDNDCDDEYAHKAKDNGKDRDDDNDDKDDDHSWDDQFKSCSIYPNPVEDDLNLRFEGFDDDHIFYTISDSKGSKYASKVKMDIYGGKGKTKVNQYRLRKGTYVITIQDKDGKNSRSMQFIKK